MNYKKVKVYATKTCPYCTYVANWLTSKKVEFEKVLVDEDRQAAQAMVESTGQMGVPVTEIVYEDRKSEFIVGYNPPQLAYMLGVN